MVKKAFSIISLGCFRNAYDSEIAAQRFFDKGYVLKPNAADGCDSLVINTCGFIDKAKEESIREIEAAVSLKKRKKVKKVIVFGCLVKRYESRLKKHFPEVDQWRGVESFGKNCPERLKLGPRFYDFLKICEGCLNKCGFCAIPSIKGPLISRPAPEVIKEAERLDKKGVKELNIIGQDITGWGKDLKSKYPYGHRQDLTYLLRQILKRTGIEWIRLIYTHPRNFSSSLINLIAKEPRICKYIDLPIQHINDRILKVMNRGTSGEDIKKLIRRIRRKIPGCVIRSSVITGFPGEEEKEFKELLSFLKEIKFERLGAFVYSREEGTPAYNLKPQVHPGVKKRRFNEVMSLQKEIAQQAGEKFVGRKLKVLVESKDSDVFIGRTQYDAPEVDGVVFLKKKGLKIGDFYETRITQAFEYDLEGI